MAEEQVLYPIGGLQILLPCCLSFFIVACLHFLNAIFLNTEVLNFDEIQYFLLWMMLFMLYLRNLCLTQDLKILLLSFLLNFFLVLALTSKSIICSELIFFV